MKHGYSAFANKKCSCDVCKEGWRVYKNDYNRRNREKIRRQARQWREDNRDKELDRRRCYRNENREKIQEQERQRYWKDPVKFREDNRQYKKKNRDRLLKGQGAYRDRNRESWNPTMARRNQQENELSVRKAIYKYARWTEIEDEFVERGDLTAKMVAYMLGRTVYAIRARRAYLRRRVTT